MYCVNCGAKNSDTARFCRSCGQSMEEEVQPADLNGGAVSPSGPVWEKSGENINAVGEQQPYGGQSYGDEGYKTEQPYGGWQPYGTGQPYGGQQSYGTGQPYGGWQPYGTGQAGYTYQPSYEAGSEKKQKKKSKKGIVIAVVIVLLAALAGGGVFLYIKESNPIAPVKSFFEGAANFDMGKVYDSIYWGDVTSSSWMSREEFIREAKENMGDEIGFMKLAVLDHVEFNIVYEGEPYEGNDGLIRKEITVEINVEFMGERMSQELGDILLVRSGKKFLFIPVWKIDGGEMDYFF